MQFLDNDSNEWVRKAAEDYPVKPFGMDWNAVTSQMQEEKPANKPTGYFLLRYAAMLILFMLLSMVLNKYLRLDFDIRYAATSTYNKKPGSSATDLVTNTTSKEAGGTNYNSEDKLWNTIKTQPHFNALHNREPFIEQAIQPLTVPEKSANPLLATLPNIDRGAVLGKAVALSQAQIDLLKNSGSANNLSAEKSSAESQPDKKSITHKRFYTGLLIGPDFSSVKFQKTNGVGYNLGVLVGYKISSKWQLESGMLLNRKSYYSSGEYFNAEKTYLPTHAYVTKVDGYCNMFEIPLNIRYNIVQKKQAKWFAVTGISSYLMNKEDYNLTYKRYNVEYTGNKVYWKGTSNWLTAINASIGYEKAINQKLQLRIEPYLKLPLQGMGTGELPISSGGVNLGVSYPIK